MNDRTTTIRYNDEIVRRFTLASVLWGVAGILFGVFIALQLAFPALNFGIPYTTFGRLRPLHTNAAIFAFVGNMMFAGVYYSSQRLLKTRLACEFLSQVHFWGWQLIILLAAITLPLGLTRGKEYAELIWPINILVAVIWIVFGIVFFTTLARRRERSLYVAIWFYIGTIITVALLYVVNHLSLPTSLLHSYPIFGGVQDALVQWWYGHNAVAFFLTTPILGIMYYFVPKAVGRPVYSYRLSIIHFWSLIFLYIWAGPHHLLNTALPSWLQGLGMIFSLMLWAPSWGGMLNGLLTLRGAWDKLRTDPVVKFMAAAVTFYGMATFEGPLLSIKAVNALGHYTDWIIGHVHVGTLGWNGFMAAGMFYWLVPRLWGTKLHSERLANLHFWLGMIGILFYVASMWVAGIGQGLSLNELTADGSAPANTFIETLKNIIPMYYLRALGGGLYLVGYLLMVYNLFRTIRGGVATDGTLQVSDEPPAEPAPAFPAFVNAPVLFSMGIIVSACVWLLGQGGWNTFGLITLVVVTLATVAHFELNSYSWKQWHEQLLHNALPFAILSLIAVAIGGSLQIIPTVVLYRGDGDAKLLEGRIQRPYRPLELAGRDIYIREGCYNCHSQMIRTLKPDILRYGAGLGYSRLGESIYDRPFQWGSRRAGPDLAREGLLRPDLAWHYRHLNNPRELEPDSIMPAYPWLKQDAVDRAALFGKISALRTLGVPYKAESSTPGAIQADYDLQAKEIAKALAEKGIRISEDAEAVAVLAYLRCLGLNVETMKTEDRR
ncbi:MAG: cytochrome-c oxidase, cbb3-type subunit I [Verrucomicrobiota bacterium]